MSDALVQSATIQLKAQAGGGFGSVPSGGLSGGTPALAWSATGLNNGDTLTITTDGTYSFGSKVQAAQRQLAYGSDVRVNGAKITGETVGGSASLSAWGSIGNTVNIASDVLPDATIDQMYLSKGAGTLLFAEGFNGISPANGIKHYVSMWIMDGIDLYRSVVAPYSSVVGTFNTSADWSRGEAITINRVSDTTLTGYISRDDSVGSYITFESTEGFGAGGVASLSGATVTGVVSGAVATLGSISSSVDAPLLSATKILRIYQEANAGEGAQSTTIVTSRTSNGTVDVDYNENGVGLNVPPYDSASSDSNQLGSPSATPKQWVHYELEADFSGALGRITIKQNGTTIHERADYPVDKLSPNFGFRLVNIGMDTPGTGNAPDTAIGGSVRFGKLYADSDLLRAYIADAATLSASTERTPLPINSWAGTQVEVDLYGSASGKHVIICDGFSEIAAVQL